ncbi:hypothetical protein PR048_025887 [Dryococelus australis]|uniref:Apple domain-containing protein n=1 Tax=Dryococelus australis TaxID=614101 RepID=A0ABQ9GJT4_9NEOP|nr:hypothetical protein PR048_025887 [Dryococelus australis]
MYAGRLDVTGFGRSVCELSATPSGQLDVGFDLYPDPDFDYYEWDRGSSPGCRAGPPTSQQRPLDRWGATAPGPAPSHRPWRPYGGGWGNYEPSPPSWRPSWRPHTEPAQGAVGYPRPQPPQPPPPPPPPPPPSPPPAQDCFLRYRTGFRLDRRAVRVSLSVPSVHECEAECGNQKHFICNTFSFRYSLEPNFPSDNCQLSERLYRDLDPYTDLLPDRDYDIYVRNEHSGTCRPPLRYDVMLWQDHLRVLAECFIRVRTGQRIDHAVVKETLSAHSVVDCEIECLRSRFFTCRLFSYRYGSPVIGGSPHNCQLSDWPFTELDPRRDVLEDTEYELYERGSYGHGCEVDRRPPALPPRPGDVQCYVGYGRPARLLPSSVKSSLSVPSEDDCKAECTKIRDKFIFYCAAFSFRSKQSYYQNAGHNCLLTDIDQRDLRPGLDYAHEDGHWLFAWDSRDPRCSAPVHHHPNHIGHLASTALAIPEPGNAWQKFTVSGRPCRFGTFCTENRVAGFWSCELEGGDAGSFDYCCRLGHHCGYSEGYNYPWCYVGSANRDQWRPCSDQYFPYREHQHDGPGLHHHGDSGPPRHWPVAYLHAEGPPNATVDYPRRIYPQFDDRENYIGLDTYRYSYGKQLEVYPPANRSAPYQQVVQHKEEDRLMFDVVDEKMEASNSSNREIPAPTTTAQTQMVRLHPRLAQMVPAMAEKTQKVPVRVWSWRESDLEGRPTGRVVYRRRVRPGPIFMTATKPVPLTVSKLWQS